MIIVRKFFSGEVKEILLVLIEALVDQKKKISVSFSKAKTKFYLSLYYNGGNSYLFVNRKEMLKFKANNTMSTFQLNYF